MKPTKALVPPMSKFAFYLVLLGVSLPEIALAASHGAAIFKLPVGPDGTANALAGDLVTCRISVVNLDDYGDSLTVTSIVDVVHHAVGDISSSNLLATPVTLVGYRDSITVTNTYLVQASDVGLLSHSLLDDAEAWGIDNHDGPGGSFVPQWFLITFPGVIDLGGPLVHGAAIFKSVAGPDGTQNAQVGDTITAKITVRNLDQFGDTITVTGIYDTNQHFGGSIVSANLLPAPVVLSPLGSFGNNSVEVTFNSPVLPGDNNLPGRILTDNALAVGFDNHDGAGGSAVRQPFQITFPGQIFVARASLSLAQYFAPGMPDGVYSGSVSNSGNSPLSGVVLSNLVNGVFTYVLGPISLGVNQEIAFTNAFLPLPPASPVANTLFASGIDQYGSSVVATLALQIQPASSPLPAAYTFTTLAGSPRFGSADGVGTAAQFNTPRGLAMDGLGNLYVADGNNTIRKITPNGEVSTMAGTAGASGRADGTNGLARFSGPTGVAVGSTGNVYVADGGNGSIRKIAPDGTNWVVTTIAAFQMPLAVAVENAGNVDNLYVADGINTTVSKLTPLGGSWMVTTVPGFIGSLSSVTVNRTGTLYIADSDLNTVRKITPVGNNWVLSAIAGTVTNAGAADGTNTNARFRGPSRIAVDTATNLYVADTLNNTIRKIAPVGTNWVVSTLAGSANRSGSKDGTGTNALFFGPDGVTVDNTGNLYVADSQNGVIRQVTSAGVVSTIAGSISAGSANGSGNLARFDHPFGIAVDSAGSVYVADGSNAIIRKITSAGLVTTLAGLAGSRGSLDGAGDNARFLAPFGVAVDVARSIYVTDNNTVRRITPAGIVTTLAGSATDGPGFRNDTNTAARFNSPLGVAVDTAGNVFVADSLNHSIRMISFSGLVTTIAGSGMSGSIDGIGTNALFNLPTAIALDSGGELLVADSANSIIRKISHIGTTWIVTTVAGQPGLKGSQDGKDSEARFNLPQGVVVDLAGSLYVADAGDNTIRSISPGGLVTTIAGIAGYTGSADGAGIAARFSSPVSIAVDAQGDLFVADTANNTIRKGIFTAYTGAKLVPYEHASMTNQLCVTLLPQEANGQWRFPWELAWRKSGEAATNLTAGNYPVEFRDLSGWLAIPPSLASVPVSGVTPITNQYYPTIIMTSTNEETGWLSVDLGPNPPAGAGWRFAGDAIPFPAYPSGYTTNLLPGTYVIEFAGPFSGRVTPPTLAVEVLAGLPTLVSETYFLAASPPDQVLLPHAVASKYISDFVDFPFGFNGQLVSEVGFGSGVAVQSNIVLTAAHLVFDDRSLSYAQQVFWFSQREKDVFEPVPLQARAFYVLSGYAAERTTNLLSGRYAPGESTPPSRNLDVAALYFESYVAQGGYGGYLPSDAVPNSWLSSDNLKMLVGYPVDGSVFGDASIISGKMYSTTPQPYPLELATDPVPDQQQVYTATWFLGYPGNSGGPLYVQFNGYFYPAAVYLGTLYSGNVPYASLVRAIDSNVVNLITIAQGDAGTGTNNTGGGVITILPDQTITAHHVGYVRLQLAPAAAVRAGAAWKFNRDSSFSTAPGYTRIVASTNPITLQFRAIPGWNLPTNETVTVSPGFVATNTAIYTELPIRLSYRTSEGLRLYGSTGLTYRIESTTRLSLTNWITNSTLTLSNLSLTNNSQIIGGTKPDTSPRRLFRAIRMP